MENEEIKQEVEFTPEEALAQAKARREAEKKDEPVQEEQASEPAPVVDSGDSEVEVPTKPNNNPDDLPPPNDEVKADEVAE